MMAGKSNHFTTELLSQNLSRLYVPPLFIQRHFSTRHEHPDPVFLDHLDIRQVVYDGQQLLFHQKISCNLRSYAGFLTLFTASCLTASLDHLSDRKPSSKKKPEHGER